MQLETPLQVVERDERQLAISLEFVAYVAILVVALILRLAQADSTPMNPSETHNALAAWRLIMPNAAGDPLISNSSLLFALQSLSFGLFGATELTARIATIIGGALLILSPLLFRPLLGATRALLFSLLLALSPVLLIGSRESAPDVWALLIVALCLWAFWKARQTSQSRYPVLAVVLFAVLLFLTGSGGVALALILLGAGAITALWQRRTATEDEADTQSGWFGAIIGSLGLALPLAALTVLAISTGFMLYPEGLSAVGEGIGGALRAVIQPSGINGYATLIALFYEPGLWLFAAVSLILRRERLTISDIFLTVWVVLAIIASLFFADGSPQHALWITVPLAGLAVNTILWFLTPEDEITYLAAPRWARWLIAAATIGILAVLTLALQSMARSLLQAPEPLLTMVSPQPDSVILLLVSVLFLGIGYFLFASLWGSRTSWQGMGLGIGIFVLVTSLGSGWNVAVTGADNPVEFWHMQATSGDTTLLRETLFDVADRISGGWASMPVTVIAPQDGEVAWVLRDFDHAAYIDDLKDAAGDPVVLLPGTMPEPDLGSAYVGQDFTISRTWDTDGLSPIDFPAWWTQRQTRVPWMGADRLALWLRQDVYLGLDQQAAQ